MRINHRRNANKHKLRKGRIRRKKSANTRKSWVLQMKHAEYILYLQKETSTCCKQRLLNEIIPTNIKDRGRTAIPRASNEEKIFRQWE